MDSSEANKYGRKSINSEIPDLTDLVGKNWVTLKQLADAMGVTYQTALKWAKDGKVKTVKVGGTRRVYEDEFRRFLEEGNA